MRGASAKTTMGRKMNAIFKRPRLIDREGVQKESGKKKEKCLGDGCAMLYQPRGDGGGKKRRNKPLHG